eukprot:comp14283_c0_seq1/m.10282 comp14283_c0_seq1/g.10282  ORF comp14283_c0_seq1/g.10282 comp14283_c0_seq1/m.10282 type:complete len:109 (-) comp14283_c0_seq1:408-734(-)
MVVLKGSHHILSLIKAGGNVTSAGLFAAVPKEAFPSKTYFKKVMKGLQHEGMIKSAKAPIQPVAAAAETAPTAKATKGAKEVKEKIWIINPRLTKRWELRQQRVQEEA